MLIYPAIDILEGKCVRLTQGDYNQVSIYGDDPLDVAKGFLDEGAKWVHIVDLGAAKSGVLSQLPVVERIARLGIQVQLGGGMRSIDAVNSALRAGATRTVAGTALVEDPSFRESFFSLGSAAVAGVDVRDGLVRVSGWTENAKLPVVTFLQTLEKEGATLVILTDISKDGMLQGPNLSLLGSAMDACSMGFIQSGGISTVKDLERLSQIRDQNRIDGAIIGKAIYENRLTVKEAIATVSTL